MAQTFYTPVRPRVLVGGRSAKVRVRARFRPPYEPDRVHEIHHADADQYLTASEIGSFTFCPQAWHLQRRATPRTRAGAAMLDSGTRQHQQIAGQTDRVRAADMVLRLL